MAAADLSSLYGSSAGSIDTILVIIAIIFTLRIYRIVNGTKFSTIGLYRLPVIYLALAAFSLVALSPSYLDVVIAVVALVVGLLIGLRLAGGVHFFEKNGAVYYKRSILIMVIWLVSFIIRFGVDLFYSSVPYASLAAGFLLSATTGVIIGEAVHIKRNYERYRKKAKTPEQ